MHPRLRAILCGGILAALVPASLFGILAFLDEETQLAGVVGGLWVWSALPGALILPGRGVLTFAVVELFWLALGSFAGFATSHLRSRRVESSR